MGQRLLSRIEAWKNLLLDLGKRNKLIKFLETKRGNVTITSPSCDELYDAIVEEDVEVVFPYCKKQNLRGDTVVVPGDVETNKSADEVQKTLKALRYRAKTSIEEQGINTLYLTFGMLKWSEHDDAQEILSSPLILVPVKLLIESISSPYRLALHDEDEIVVNPTLAHKLNNDFGVTLPEFDEKRGSDVEAYLEELAHEVEARGWSVEASIHLTNLSFLKINMYKDLERNTEKLSSNPIIAALAGEKSFVLNPEGFNDLNNFDHDKEIRPRNTFQVVDADSSQQDAILLSKKGVSFVLQGPPGTGKSQTITNIIAEKIAAGKNVLFVSEKMAALQVVYNRLKEVGLADFCLTLHNHKTKKKDILRDLERSTNIVCTRVREKALTNLDILEEKRKSLNAYDKELHTPTSELKISIYEVNGILSELKDVPDVSFSIPNIEQTTEEELRSRKSLLDQLAKTVGKRSEDYKGNVWRDSKIKFISNAFRHEIDSNVSRVLPQLKKLEELHCSVCSKLGISVEPSLVGVDTLAQILSYASASPIIPSEWVLDKDISFLIKEASQHKAQAEFIVSTSNKLKNKYGEQILNIDVAKYKGDLCDLIQRLQIQLNKKTDNDFVYEDGRSAIENIQTISSKLDWISRTTQTSDRASGVPPAKRWFDLDALSLMTKTLDAHKSLHDRASEIKGQILSTFDKEILTYEFYPTLQRFRCEYCSFLRVFKRGYRRDTKNISSYLSSGGRLSYGETLDLLNTLKRFSDTQKEIADNKQSYLGLYGPHYDGVNTQWNAIRELIKKFEMQVLDIPELMQDLDLAILLKTSIAKLSEQKETVSGVYKHYYDGVETDWGKLINALNYASALKLLADQHCFPDEFIRTVCEDTNTVEYCKYAFGKILDGKKLIYRDVEWFVSLFEDNHTFYSYNLIDFAERMSACKEKKHLLEEWIDYCNNKDKCKNAGLGVYVEKIEEGNIPSNYIVDAYQKCFYRLWLDAVLPKFPAVKNFRERTHTQSIREFCELDKGQFEIARARIREKILSKIPNFDTISGPRDEVAILKGELNKQRRLMPLRKLFAKIPKLMTTLRPCFMMSPLSVSLFLEAQRYDFDLVIFDEASQVRTEDALGAMMRGKQVIVVGDSKQLPPTNFFSMSINDEDFDVDSEENLESSNVGSYESILDEAVTVLPHQSLRWHYRSRHEHLIAFSNLKIYNNRLVTFPSSTEKAPDCGVEYIYVENGVYDRGKQKNNLEEAQKVADLIFKHIKNYGDTRSLGVVTFSEAQQDAVEAAIRQKRMEKPLYEDFFVEDKEEPFFIKNLENVQGDERDTIIFSIGYARNSSGIMSMNFGPLNKVGGERRLNVAITRAKRNVKLVGSIRPTDIDVEKTTSEGVKLLRSYIEFAEEGYVALARETNCNSDLGFDSPFEASVYDFLHSKGYDIVKQVGCSGYRIDMAVKHPTRSGEFAIGIECDGAMYHSARTARERDRLRQTVLEDMGWTIYRIWSTDWIKDQKSEEEKLISAIEKSFEEIKFDKKKTDFVVASADDEGCPMETLIEIEEPADVHISPETNYGFEVYRQADVFKLIREGRKPDSIVREVISLEQPIHFDELCSRVAPVFGRQKATRVFRKVVENIIYGELKGIIETHENNEFIGLKTCESVKVRVPNPSGNYVRNIKHISHVELGLAMKTIAQKSFGIIRDDLFIATAREFGFKRTGGNINFSLQNVYDHMLKVGEIREIDGKVQVLK